MDICCNSYEESVSYFPTSFPQTVSLIIPVESVTVRSCLSFPIGTVQRGLTCETFTFGSTRSKLAILLIWEIWVKTGELEGSGTDLNFLDDWAMVVLPVNLIFKSLLYEDCWTTHLLSLTGLLLASRVSGCLSWSSSNPTIHIFLVPPVTWPLKYLLVPLLRFCISVSEHSRPSGHLWRFCWLIAEFQKHLPDSCKS